MRSLIERLLAENINHRELFGGQEVRVNMHTGTANTLKKSPKRKSNPRGYEEAIRAHEKAAKMYADLKEGKGLVKAIRAAKKVAKEAHILTRKLG